MRRRGGFTVVELMVVVAILGITAGIVVTNFKRNPTAGEARRIAAAMAAAHRTAIAAGPIRAEVVTNFLGGARHRSELTIARPEGGGDGYLVSVWRFVEDPAPANTGSWVNVQTIAISPEVEITRVTDSAQIGLSAQAISAGGLPATKHYYPNGSADAFTVYLRHKRQQNATRYRVVGLPLSPAPQVFQDW